MRPRRIGALAVGAAVLASPVPARAAAPQAVAFAGKTSLELSPGATARASLCNGTARAVTVHTALVGIARVRIVGLGAGGHPFTVGAAACRTTVLRAGKSAAGAAGTLVATTSRGIVTVPVRLTTVGALAPAVAMLSLEGRHRPGGGAAGLSGSAFLPLGPYARGTIVHAPSAATAAALVAVLQNGGHRAYLRVDRGSAKLVVAHGYAQLPLRLDGADHTGTYTGTLTLAGKKVSVSVAVGDPWWWCVVAILVGIAAVVLTTIVAQRWWPRRQVHAAAGRVREELGRAIRCYNLRRGSLPQLHLDGDATRAYVDKVKDAYARATRRTLIVDAESDGYKHVLELIDEARDDAAYVASHEGLRSALAELSEALARTARAEIRPAAYDTARKLRFTRSIGPGDATALGARAASFTNLLSRWLELWADCAECRDLLDEVPRVEPPPGWTSASALLDEIEYELRRVAQADGLDPIESLLHSARRRVFELRERYPELAAPEPTLAPERIAAAFLIAPMTLADRTFHAALPALHVSATRVVGPAVQRAVRAATGAAGIMAAPAAYALVVALAVATALSAGLTTVYSSTFGSFTDYVAAVGLGSAAGVGSKAVLDALNGLRKVTP